MTTYLLEVNQTGYHGLATLPIRGRNWRAYNPAHVACDMAPADVQAMYDVAGSYCGMADCCCGGIYLPTPSEVPAGPDTLPTTWLLPTTWIPDQAREECAEIATALDECDRLLDADLARMT